MAEIQQTPVERANQLRTEVLAQLEERGIRRTSRGLESAKHGHLVSPFKVLGGAQLPDDTVNGAVIAARGSDGHQRVAHVTLEILQSPMKLAPVLSSINVVPPIEPAKLRAIAEYVHEMSQVTRCPIFAREGIHWIASDGRDRPVAVIGQTTISDSTIKSAAVTRAPFLYRPKGTLEAWKSDFQPILRRNPLVSVAMMVGLAAPFPALHRLPAPSLLYTGESGTGKTTCTRAALSCFGPSDKLDRWSATPNGLESLAAAHCDALLVLDELGTAESAALGPAIYRMSEGKGKARSTSSGALAEQAVIRCPVLASGELDASQHALAGGHLLRKGHEARMQTISVDEAHGAFSNLPRGCENGADLSRLIERAADANHGVVMPAFLRKLIENHERLQIRIAEHVPKIRQEIGDRTGCDPSDQVEGRVLERFVTLAVAGRLASHYDILPMSSSAVTDAVCYVLSLWLNDWRTVTEETEDKQVAQIRSWFRLRSHVDFVPLVDWNLPGHRGRIGYVTEHKDHGKLFLVHVEEMRKTVCKGLDAKRALHALDESGLLQRGSKGLQWWHRMPGIPKDAKKSRMPFYAIRGDVLFGD